MYRRKPSGWVKHIDFIILDLIVLQLSYVLAYMIRHGAGNPYAETVYLNIAVIMGIFSIGVSVFMSNHKNILSRGFLREAYYVVLHIALIGLGLMAYLFFMKVSIEFSRLVLIYFVIIGAILEYIERLVWKALLRRGFFRFGKRDRMIIISNSNLVEEAINGLLSHTYGEYEIGGVVLTDDAVNVSGEIAGAKVLAAFGDIIEYLKKNWVDGLFIYLPENENLSKELLDEISLMGITTHKALVMSNDYTNRTVERLGGALCITESAHIASFTQVFIKRTFDIVVSFVGLLFTLIFTIIVGPIIFISDPGPIFFGQNRIGKNGRYFKMYKFRSMYKDAEARKKELMDKNEMQGLMFKMENDPRIIGSGKDGTKHGIGWFIRKTSIDEFPQFFNVLKGDMSLVGTRPPTIDEWNQYDPRHRARMSVKPGITGMWQVSGRSDITDFEEIVKLDVKYINTWSLALDLKILFKTVAVVFIGRGSK